MRNTRQNPHEFSATTWQHAAPGGWYFVTLPVDVSSEIRAHFKWQEEGWGRLKVLAKLVQANGILLFGSTRNARVIYYIESEHSRKRRN